MNKPLAARHLRDAKPVGAEPQDEAFDLAGLLAPGGVGACVAGLIDGLQQQMPECLAAVASVDGATGTVVGIETAQGTDGELMARLVARLGAADFFAATGLGPDGGVVAGAAGIAGLDHGLWAAHRLSDALVMVAVVWRDDGFGPFGPADAAQVKAFAAEVSGRLRLRIAYDRESIAELGLVFDQCGMALLVLEDSMVLRHANGSGESAIRDGHFFARDGERLQLSNAALDARIRRNFSDLLSAPGRPRRSMVLPIQNARDGSLIKATVIPRRTVRDQLAGAPELALVIPYAEREAAVSADDLVELGLTRAEAELVAALLEGKTVKEYAKLRGRAIPTVRAHLKRVMIRLRVHRQADLVRVLLGMKNAGVL